MPIFNIIRKVLLKMYLIIVSVVLMKGQSRFVIVTWAPDGQGAESEPHALVP